MHDPQVEILTPSKQKPLSERVRLTAFKGVVGMYQRLISKNRNYNNIEHCSVS